MTAARGLNIVFAGCAVLALGACETLRSRKAEPAPTPPTPAEQPAEAPKPQPLPPPAVRVQPPPPRSCVPRTLGPPPRYPDSDAALRAAAGAADRYQLMAAGRLMRQQRLEELERVLAGCR